MQSGLQRNLDTAWIDGIQLSIAKRVSIEETKRSLYKSISDLVNYIDANKTLDNEGIKGAVDFILEDFWQYPLEEIILIIRSMKKDADYFERLKYPEIKKKLDAYFDSESRALKIERHHDKFKDGERVINKLDDVDYKAYKERMAKEDLEPKKSKNQDEVDYHNFKANYIKKKQDENQV